MHIIAVVVSPSMESKTAEAARVLAIFFYHGAIVSISVVCTYTIVRFSTTLLARVVSYTYGTGTYIACKSNQAAPLLELLSYLFSKNMKFVANVDLASSLLHKQYPEVTKLTRTS